MKIIFISIIVQHKFLEPIFRMSMLNENYFVQNFSVGNLLDEKRRITIRTNVCTYVYSVVCYGSMGSSGLPC